MKISAAINHSLVLPNLAQNDQRQPPLRDRSIAESQVSVDQASARSQAAEYVFQGELLDSVANDKRFGAGYYQQIDPRNRNAIENYQATGEPSAGSESLGRLVDRFI